MNRFDPHDPRPLLALILAILVLWLSRHLSGLSPTSLLSSAGGPLAPIAVGALVLASALAIQRLVSTDRTLRSRRELAVIPADDFDPKPDAVLRFAAELVSTRRSTLGWLDRRASAVRVRLTRDPGGRLVYLLGVPERSVRLLRAALETYDGVEVRDAGEVLVGRDPGERLASAAGHGQRRLAEALLVAGLADPPRDRRGRARDLTRRLLGLGCKLSSTASLSRSPP